MKKKVLGQKKATVSKVKKTASDLEALMGQALDKFDDGQLSVSELVGVASVCSRIANLTKIRLQAIKLGKSNSDSLVQEFLDK